MTHDHFARITIGRVSAIAFAGALSVLSPGLVEQPQQPSSPEQAAQTSAISQSGLLPMFAVDLQIEPAWVDGSTFPSSSTKYANRGASDALQRTWDLLKQGGFNVVRFPLNSNDTQSATRLANLCVWAKANGVLLVPVLNLDATKSSAAEAAAGFVKALVGKMRVGSDEQLPAYAQISYYQIGDRLNHAGLHRGQSVQQLQQQALAAAEALRHAEVQALDGSGVLPTPIMISTSYDYELIQQGLINGVPLDPGGQSKATSGLTDFIAPFASSSSVDAISVEWLPRSFTAGDVDGFAGLVQALSAVAPGKQMVLTTGFSSAFHAEDEQRQFLVLTATNLADLRAAQGNNPTFVGVIFRNGLNGADPSRKPEPDISQWQWPQRAKELKELWSQGRGSSDIKWWVAKIDANLGVVKLRSGSTPSALPALQIFQQIATSAQQAVQTVTPYPVSANGGQVTQYPGAAQASNAAQVPQGSNLPYPSGSGWLGPGGVPNTGTTSSPSGSNTQQMLFGILNQFTTQLSAALASRIQSGKNPSQNYGGAANFGPPPSNYVPPAGGSSYPGSIPAAGSQPPDTPAPNLSSGSVNTNATSADNGIASAGTSASSRNNGYPDPGATGSPGAGGPPSSDTGGAGGKTTIAPGGVKVLKLKPMPRIASFALMKDAAPSPIRGKKSVFMQTMVLQLSNPADTMSAPVQAELRMDNKVVRSQAVGPLLPRQSRSVVFGLPTTPGNHKLQLNLKGANGATSTETTTLKASPSGTVSATGSKASGGLASTRGGTNSSRTGAAVLSTDGSGTATGNLGVNPLPAGNQFSGGVRTTLPGIRLTRVPTISSGLTLGPAPAISSHSATPGVSKASGKPVRNLATNSAGAPRTGSNTSPSSAAGGKSAISRPGPTVPVGLVRPGPGSNARTANSTSATASIRSGSVTPERPGSGARTAYPSVSGSKPVSPPPRLGDASAALPARPSPAAGTGSGMSTSAMTAGSSLTPRPGPPAGGNAAHLPPGTLTGARSTTKAASTAKSNTNLSGCAPASQPSQQKSLPPCKPGQTTSCAEPICK